eukprot:TRINITY_DN11763_c0_g1_i1.p2 TRINITY_DN11763_c0_g1~~TRINITY_DN11763_c0_g1_i1.p2  ORF type:complete len:174 (+),score=44.78 TRINITY_DN11763_c0_g1_i1:108-629(+)
MGDFNEGLCGCFEDAESCLISFCLPCVQVGKNAESVGMGDCVGFALLYLIAQWAIGGGFIVHFLTRMRLREVYGFRENACEDILVSLFCAHCAMAQEAREIKARGAVPRHYAQNGPMFGSVQQPQFSQYEQQPYPMEQSVIQPYETQQPVIQPYEFQPNQYQVGYETPAFEKQ